MSANAEPRDSALGPRYGSEGPLSQRIAKDYNDNPIVRAVKTVGGVEQSPPSEQNPFEALMGKAQGASNPDFDSIVNDVLSNPTPVQGADAPMPDAGTKAKKPGPIFNDLHMHFPGAGDVGVPDSNEPMSPDVTKKESIF